MPRRRTPPYELVLVPVGAVDDVLLRELGEALRERLDVQWRIGTPLPLDDGWMDARSGMCCSLKVLQSLPAWEDAEGRGGWLAIAEPALCAGGVGEVLGEAEVGGRRAVIGLAPLRRGSGVDGDVLMARLLTEALHELGHLAGWTLRARIVRHVSLGLDRGHRPERPRLLRRLRASRGKARDTKVLTLPNHPA